jgi:TonB-linked SusC/RagA family outer membrane protein
MKCLLTGFQKPLQSKALLVMKLTVLLILFFTFNVSANGFGQEKISLKVKNTELSGVLRSIEKQTTYRFLYNDKLEDIREKVTLNVKDADITLVLYLLLQNTKLLYQQMANNLIVIKEIENPADVKPDIIIHGRIIAEDGSPLAGASVQIKGTNTGTTTNNEGNFTLTVPNANVTLVISSVGYNRQEIALAGRTDISIALVASTRIMDEVVVTGYGTASKRDLTGSIVKIAGKEVADKPNTNPVASLQSKVAGLSVVNNGTPGLAPDIRIRGTISIGSVTPLYVVDGIFNDNIDYINPNDIESIDILKDPSSLAIFGVRGAAGVIAITTKKAKPGQVIVNFNTSYGFKKLVDKIELANSEQFKTLFEEEKLNLNTPIPPFDYTPWTANTDWIDAVTRTGHFNANNLSVSGSTEKNKFTMGIGYTADEGIIRHEKLEKILFSLNDEFKISKAIKIGFNFNGVRLDNPYDPNNYAQYVLNDARKVAPIVPSGTKTVFTKNPYGLDSMNQVLYYELPSIQNSGVVNPLIGLENEWDKTIHIEYRMVASVFAEVNFLKDFNFKTTLYADMSNSNRRKYTPLYNSYDPVSNAVFLVSPATKLTENDNTYRKFQQDHILTYKRKFGSHNITALAGFTTYYFGNFNRSGSVNQSSTGSPIPDDKRFWFISNGFGDAQSQRSSSSQAENTTVSGLLRLLYNYQNKYYLNASFRHDGSSQISPKNRWQDFWALGAAWELSREDFMSNQKIFDFVKLKASIGNLGNQNTYGYPYPFYPGLRGGAAAVFGNNIYNAYSQAYLPDPNLKWESVHAKEVGLELSAFKNRLHFEAAYFDKVTKDLMTYVPGINGASDGLSNIGSIKNSGVELSASWEQKFSKDFSITVSGNLTTYKNEVLELATKDFAIISGYNRTVVGEPIGSFYGYIVEGVYQSYADKLASPVNTEFSYGPGDLKYKDINGDGKINTADRTIIGNPTPDFAYGGTISVNYKGFDLGVDVGGVYGNEIYRNWGGTESPFQRVNYPAFKINRWHGEGTSNWDPILGQDHRINYESSTYGIEDGSYFRIRNLQLGYNFSPRIISKMRAKNLRLFANVQNLKTFKHNLGYTPEFGGSAISFGVDNAGGAIPMVTTFGINVTF